MAPLTAIGEAPWTREEILASIDDFSTLYAGRPIRDNRGGMKAPHMFALWFVARALSPDLVVESGVWKGQSTWLLEKACPDARLISIDLNLGAREYISDRAIYSNRDFSEHDWSGVTDRSLAFFDDHQNAYKRLQQCRWFGFKHVIFEDNYPPSQGDCYSLKKAFANAGFEPSSPRRRRLATYPRSGLIRRLARISGAAPSSLIPQYESSRIEPNDIDSRMLHRHLETYYEFPPVFKTEKTRWGDAWDEETYPTPQPLLDRPTKPCHGIFVEEADNYTWICYAKLK